jgi:hypothetical protein
VSVRPGGRDDIGAAADILRERWEEGGEVLAVAVDRERNETYFGGYSMRAARAR